MATKVNKGNWNKTVVKSVQFPAAYKKKAMLNKSLVRIMFI